MDFIKVRKPDINILMEDTQPETVETGVRFLRGYFPV
jgi:hypothetical protein